MGKIYASEITAIESLRAQRPSDKQMTLAKNIRKGNFTDPNQKSLAASVTANGRSVLSIYSVIRRFDAKVKALVEQVA